MRLRKKIETKSLKETNARAGELSTYVQTDRERELHKLANFHMGWAMAFYWCPPLRRAQLLGANRALDTLRQVISDRERGMTHGCEGQHEAVEGHF